MSRYEVILSRSEDDQASLAEVPERPGCAADGATDQDVLSNAEVMRRPARNRFPVGRIANVIPEFRPPFFTCFS